MTARRANASDGKPNRDGCVLYIGEGSGQSWLFLSGHPRPGDWIVIDGRSPGSRIYAFICLPAIGSQ